MFRSGRVSTLSLETTLLKFRTTTVPQSEKNKYFLEKGGAVITRLRAIPDGSHGTHVTEEQNRFWIESKHRAQPQDTRNERL